MITRIVVPDLGVTGADVRVAGWLATEGDHVAAGAPLFALESDKATHDVEAYRAGYLRKILAPVDARVEIGAVVALLSDAVDEPLNEPVAKAVSLLPGMVAALPRSANPSTGRIAASPLAKKLAQEHGLDLSNVSGSGREGQIHKRDVLNAIATGADQPFPSATGQQVALSPMRRAIAQRTQASKSEVPHFFAEVTIDVTDALTLRERLRHQAQRHGRAAPTVNDFFLLAAAQALKQVPALNASFQKDALIYFADVTLGMVVAVADGMLTPVIHSADRLGLWSMARTTRELRKRAESGRLNASDLAGGALTVSNLGMHGLDRFTAIINPPQAAVLAVGAACPRPAVFQGQLAVRTLLDVTLSLDHRVADGVAAAQFLCELRRRVQEPVLLPIDDPAEVNA